MATIKPFNALRYTKKIKNINEVLCPPYDIISEEERKDFLKTNEYNIIRLELPKEGENPYKTAGETLDSFINSDILKKDSSHNLYFYEEEFEVNNQVKKIKGLICLVKLEEFKKKIVLPHEETLSKAKADRFNLMSKTNCNFSQIYCLYDDDGTIFSKIDNITKSSPEITTKTDDNIVHRLWKTNDSKLIKFFQNNFNDKQLFIADGHHRYETALNYRNYLKEKGIIKDENHLANYVMMMLVDLNNEGLCVFPTHRMLKGLENFDELSVISKLQNLFEIEKKNNINQIEKELSSNINNKVLGFYTGKEYWYMLILKDISKAKDYCEDCSETLAQLDVSILHNTILNNIFGIDKENMKNQKNLTYTRDLSEAIEKVKSKEFQCSFILNPTQISEIRDIALNNEKMPQKSTYFYPKLITGLVMNKFID